MKKKIALFLTLTLLVSAMAGFQAAADEGASFTRGATVTADADSPTGYTVTFVFFNEDAIMVLLGYNMTWLMDHEDVDADPVLLSEFRPGLFPVGGMPLAMENMGGGYWVLSIPLPGGTMTYNFVVFYEDSPLDDDGNPVPHTTGDPYNHLMTPHPTDADYVPGQSFVFVPFNAALQHPLNNRDLERPRDDQVGTVIVNTYDSVTGEPNWYTIYLPYGFNVNRPVPYPVIFAYHGAGGNERSWMDALGANRVMDNLIAYGMVEPTIVVGINANPLNFWGGGFHGPHDVAVDDLMNYLIPHIEATYNTSSDPAQRAVLGLSMGASVATTILFDETDQFGYLGMFSGGGNTEGFDFADLEGVDLPVIIYGYGIFAGFMIDFLYRVFPETLEREGIPHSYYAIPGGHAGHVWTTLFTIFVRDYVWQSEPIVQAGLIEEVEEPEIAEEPVIVEHQIDALTIVVPVERIGGIALLPLRLVAESLEYNVEWHRETRSVSIELGDFVSHIFVDDANSPVQFVGNRTFVSIDFIEALFGVSVNLVNGSALITVY